MIRNVATESCRLVPIGCVARHAVRGIQRVVSIDVASGAGCRRRRHVRANQSETGRTVIKFSVRPGGDGMARRASGGR